MKTRLILLAMLLAAPARADVVADWVAVAERGFEATPLPPTRQRPAARAAPSLVALAMFEAVNSLDPRYRSHLGISPAPAPGSAEAAAATAAHAVLASLFPDARARLDEALLLTLAGTPAAAREAGAAAGRVAAAAALARPMSRDTPPPPYRPTGEPGAFAPPDPHLIQPAMLAARLWFIDDPEAVMPPPPPALNSATYARDFDEVKRFGVGRPGATAETLARARFLGSFQIEPLARRALGPAASLVDRARFAAMLEMALFDANAMIGISKVRYSTWRPFNAIRNADRDGNAATARDPEWLPVMPTPNHPEYPCGHCTISSVVATMLAPIVAPPLEVGSGAAPVGITMRFADWNAFVEAANFARIEGGMHFRFSNDAGRALGRRIAALAQAGFAPPLAAGMAAVREK